MFRHHASDGAAIVMILIGLLILAASLFLLSIAKPRNDKRNHRH